MSKKKGSGLKVHIVFEERTYYEEHHDYSEVIMHKAFASRTKAEQFKKELEEANSDCDYGSCIEIEEMTMEDVA